MINDFFFSCSKVFQMPQSWFSRRKSGTVKASDIFSCTDAQLHKGSFFFFCHMTRIFDKDAKQ